MEANFNPATAGRGIGASADKAFTAI
jgi:hypothetical protein